MSIEIEQIIRHATMANFDNECTSIVILMVANGDPEAHMVIAPKDVFIMNGAVDMFKMEMYKMMQTAVREKGKRE